MRAYLQQLVGQPFLHVRFSDGDELALHFGPPREYGHPRMKHLVKGSYVLGTRASEWRLRSEPHRVVALGVPWLPEAAGKLTAMTNKELEAADIVQPGARVVAADPFPLRSPAAEGSVSGYGLSLQLSDGSSVLISPDPAAAPDESLADWELFTPYERLLRVGPGPRWSYTPSRRPAAAPPGG